MPQITIPVALPDINLGQIVPIVALVILGALILMTLTARSLIKSRAFGLGLLALIIIAGSATIVGSLQAIAIVIGVAGVVAIGGVVVLGRNPDVLDVVRTAVEQQAPRVSSSGQTEWTPLLIDHRQPINQLPDAGQTSAPQATAPRRRSQTVTLPKDWGF